MKGKLALFALLVFVSTILGCDRAVPAFQDFTQGIWICLYEPWMIPRGAPVSDREPESTHVAMVRFEKSGEFSMIQSVAYRFPNGSIRIGGEGGAAYIGSWRRSESVINASYRLVFRWMVKIEEETLPGPELSSTFSYNGDHLQLNGQSFIQSKEVDAGQYQQYVISTRKRLFESNNADK